MFFPAPKRALVQSMLAGALVLGGASACSRPDRAESGSDNTAIVTSVEGDTAAAGYRAMERDTSTVPEPVEILSEADSTELPGRLGDETADEQPVNSSE